MSPAASTVASCLVEARAFTSVNSARTTPTLLQRIARGESAAVQECITAHGPLVWSVVRRLCPSGADADDVVQEIFIALWKSAAQYDPALGSETTWVATVSRRKLIDLRRASARRGQPAELGDDLPSAAPGQAEVAELADEAARAAQALGELRAEQRRVLELAVGHGMTYEQVSTRLAMPLGTVKSHARRGLQRVRELLARGQANKEGARA
jgi:RNA polymerase sigma-70 factor (ECF subfamily)